MTITTSCKTTSARRSFQTGPACGSRSGSRRAQAMAGEKRFFHWELEFPEAFQGENRGFDVVIGNPPYVTCSRI